MPTIYVNRLPFVCVFRHLMRWLGGLLITEFGCACWLSLDVLSFEFLGYAFQSWFNLLEHGFSGFCWDAGSWVGTVALLASGATTALA